MSDVARVQAWFDSGRLLRPDASVPGSVHLARALAALCGADVELDEPSRRIAGAIGESEHLVFVLVDGLGMNLIEAMPEGSFLRRHVAMELRSVFPSSTAPALTSLATGMWPAEHGVPGWFVYLPQRDLHTTALPFVERFSKQPLEERGETASLIYSQPVLQPRYRRDTLALMPASIGNSVYTRYICGGGPVELVESLAAAIGRCVERIRFADGPTYTYIYRSAVDTAGHDHGALATQTLLSALALGSGLQRLREELPPAARIVVSADHGQIDWHPGEKFWLHPEDELAQMLLTWPAGEPFTPTFHVRPEQRDDFASLFQRSFGDRFALLSPDDVESLQLMGPSALSAETRSRLGDFVGLSCEGEGLAPSSMDAYARMKGNHGGLRPDEMRIPLVVA